MTYGGSTHHWNKTPKDPRSCGMELMQCCFWNCWIFRGKKSEVELLSVYAAADKTEKWYIKINITWSKISVVWLECVIFSCIFECFILSNCRRLGFLRSRTWRDPDWHAEHLLWAFWELIQGREKGTGRSWRQCDCYGGLRRFMGARKLQWPFKIVPKWGKCLWF